MDLETAIQEIKVLHVGERDAILIRTNLDGATAARQILSRAMPTIKEHFPDALVMSVGVGVDVWTEKREICLTFQVHYRDDNRTHPDVEWVQKRLLQYLEQDGWSEDWGSSRSVRFSTMVCPSQLANILRDAELLAKVTTWEAY